MGPDEARIWNVHASGIGQLQANPHVVGHWNFHGKPTRRAIATMRPNDSFVDEDTCWDRVSSDIVDKRAVEAR